MAARPAATTRARTRELADGAVRVRRDSLVTEEPLEVRVAGGPDVTPVAVTMRTPGDDFALAAGLLYGEGVIAGRDDVAQIAYCRVAEQLYNVVTVELADGVAPDLGRLERHGTMTSACGVCGKTSLDAVRVRGVSPPTCGLRVSVDLLYELPGRLRAAQRAFDVTGGLHAAALFAGDGTLIDVREDVGRHNAVDKVVGRALLDGRLPLSDHVLLVSGRAGFEIAQKAVVAGVPIVCAVSAPSSLAVDLAREFGMTLVGFLRGRRCIVYAGEHRVVG